MTKSAFSSRPSSPVNVAPYRKKFLQGLENSQGLSANEPLESNKEMPNIQYMNTPTREEFEARIETIEAKMDGRVASIEGKIDTLLATLAGNEKVVAERWKTYDARFAGTDEREKRLVLLTEQANNSATVAAEASRTAAGLRASYWGSVAAQIAAVVAILVGVYFANQASVIGIGQLVTAVQQGQAPAPTKK